MRDIFFRVTNYLKYNFCSCCKKRHKRGKNMRLSNYMYYKNQGFNNLQIYDIYLNSLEHD